MTFDDDFIRLVCPDGTLNVLCKAFQLDWPPPELVSYDGVIYERQRMSALTDEQRESLTHVIRGAEYLPVKH